MNKKDIINNSFESHINLLSNMKEDFLEIIDIASQEIVNLDYKKKYNFLVWKWRKCFSGKPPFS